MSARKAIAHLRELGSPEAARLAQGFFKTGPGQYGEGDVFLGIKAAPLRAAAREFQDLSIAECDSLLQSELHEARLLALLILVRQFEGGNESLRKGIFEFYLRSTARINNWDLVDASAPNIVGAWLADRSRKPLFRLARSANLWERRIAIVATQHFIRLGDFDDTLHLAEKLLGDEEDLMHKATGWMLREVGKRDVAVLEAFLKEHCANMPRTMLRYAIERFAEDRRKQYLRGAV